MNSLSKQIESLLFVSSKPVSIKNLIKFLKVSEDEINSAISELKDTRLGSGIILLESNEGLQLATNSEYSELITEYLNSDLRESLTEAVIEVLAIVAYRQPIAKPEIEAIRGVNSQYSLRALLMRGLVEKVPNPGDARGFLYQTTNEFLQHMGLTSASELPDFAEIVKKIQLPDVPETRADEKSAGSTDKPDQSAHSQSE